MCIRLSALITSCTGISWFLAKKPARSISMCETWLQRIWFDCCTHCINTLVCILCSCESYTYTYTSSQRPRECLCCMSNVTPVATKFGPGQLKVNTCEMNDTRWDNMVQQLQRLFYRSVYIYIVYINIIYICTVLLWWFCHIPSVFLLFQISPGKHLQSVNPWLVLMYSPANLSQNQLGNSCNLILLMHLLGHWLRWVVILARQVHLDCS